MSLMIESVVAAWGEVPFGGRVLSGRYIGWLITPA